MKKDWKAPQVAMQRSSFDRSHGHKTTFNADDLIPICIDEVIPGDSVNMALSGFARMATPIYPILDNAKMTFFAFFVPLRLVWDNAEKFFGEDIVGGDGNAPVKPMATTNALAGANAETLLDYMGLPTLVPGVRYDELFVRAYMLVWEEWFRDQNLQQKIGFETGDTPTDWTAIGYPDGNPPILKRNKRHDYFTSCLPWPQKGPDIALPLFNPFGDFENANLWAQFNSQDTAKAMPEQASRELWLAPAGDQSGVIPYKEAWNDNAGTINQLRFAFAVQKYYERDSLGGTRYPEVIKAHFGITSPDARLQRPEFLGSITTHVNVTPVATTFEQSGESRTVGDLGAMATVNFTNRHCFTKSFTEHGILLGLINVSADLTYQQGLHKMWNRETRFEYYWPEFNGLGEQEVKTQEIYAGDAAAAVPEARIFGYQERFAEYRFSQSRISGLFRSYVPETLHSWHLSQQFTTEPFLNDEFITSQTPMDRVLAVSDEPDFIADFYFHSRWARPIPIYGIPGGLRF